MNVWHKKINKWIVLLMNRFSNTYLLLLMNRYLAVDTEEAILMYQCQMIVSSTVFVPTNTLYKGSSNKDFQTLTVGKGPITSVRLTVIYAVCFAKSPRTIILSRGLFTMWWISLRLLEETRKQRPYDDQTQDYQVCRKIRVAQKNLATTWRILRRNLGAELDPGTVEN